MNKEYEQVFFKLLKGKRLTPKEIEVFDVWNGNTSSLERERFYRSLSRKAEITQFPKVLSVKQLKPFHTKEFSTSIFPIGSRIVLDNEHSVIADKVHQVIWQQGRNYGEVGDMCDYITHAELFDLHQRGFIRLETKSV